MGSERRGKSVAGGGLAPLPPPFVGPCYAVATIPSVAQPCPHRSASCHPFVEPRRASPLKPCCRRRSQRRETSPSQEQEEEGVAVALTASPSSSSQSQPPPLIAKSERWDSRTEEEEVFCHQCHVSSPLLPSREVATVAKPPRRRSCLWEGR
ncbi:hypothetical protein AAHE18_11G132200 [Arachis hypogaea]|nr:uncharacterized protein DS421_11g335560 [Arachis hypogaea]